MSEVPCQAWGVEGVRALRQHEKQILVLDQTLLDTLVKLWHFNRHYLEAGGRNEVQIALSVSRLSLQTDL